jgi:uncharacterized protein YdcH (DUF465 family)
MSENSWVLRGVDPETRQQAVAEAERRGMTLADYLTEILLTGGADDVAAPDAAYGAETAEDFSFSPPPEPNFATRHRIEALERRLGLSVGGLDSAVHALDSSVFGLAARVDESETLGVDNAHNLQELLTSVAALRKRLADAEDAAEVLTESNDAEHEALIDRCAGLDQRINVVEDIARSADSGVSALGQAHEALKHAVASDFSDLARESTMRLSAGMSELRAAADTAAEQAEAAAAHLINELSTLRYAIEERMEESASETRGRMHAAFADAADRLATLAERVVDNERFTARTAEQLRSQISDVEDAAQTSIEEAAEGLRHAQAALAAEIRANAEDHSAALEVATGAIAGDIAELRDRQDGGMARVKLIDAAVSNTINDVAILRNTIEERLGAAAGDARSTLAQAQSDWEARFDALAARAAGAEREVAHTREMLRDDVARVETCAFAALEKLGKDISQVDAALDSKVALVARNADGAISDMRDQHVGALARLKLIDQAIGARDLIAATEAGAAPLAARLAQLEAAAQHVETDQAVAILQEQVAQLATQLELAASRTETDYVVTQLQNQVMGLAAQLETQRVDEGVVQRVEDLRGRLATYENQLSQSVDRVHGIARMLGRVSAQNADASTQSEDRLHKIELALADLRLERFSSAPAEAAAAPINTEAFDALQTRMAGLEQRQAEAFETLRADIAHFIGVNDRRLAALEDGGLSAAAQDTGDVAAQFKDLRERIEERVLGVELRSVRTMEQVCDAIALVEQRFLNGDQQAEAKSA